MRLPEKPLWERVVYTGRVQQCPGGLAWDEEARRVKRRKCGELTADAVTTYEDGKKDIIANGAALCAWCSHAEREVGEMRKAAAQPKDQGRSRRDSL